MNRMKIGIYGPAIDSGEEATKKAHILGRIIAQNGHKLITGACTGIPHEAVKAARTENRNIEIIGFSPSISIQEHIKSGYPHKEFTSMEFIPKDYQYKDNPPICKKYRNVSSVAYCDIAIIIAGRCGTLNEFTNAYDMGKDIGILEGTGGIADKIRIIIETINKPTKSRVIFSSDPKELIDKLTEH